IIIGASMVSVLLTVSILGLSPTDTMAQGTNATNATGAANATGTAGGGETTVVMPLGSSAGELGYEPDPVNVSPGATVIWDNEDSALHTATSGNPDTQTPDGKFDTGYITANQQSKPVTMPTEPGEYTYYCQLHPALVGTVIVQ
ncbi:MAG: plastocyanin/azurin family copper-binding protein, partial [Nitrososphaeraceae archaeon]